MPDTRNERLDCNARIRSDAMGRITVDPLHGFGREAVLADVAHEFAFQICHGAEDAAGDHVARQPLIARPVVPSCWRAWLHLARLVQERGDLPGYPLEFLDLAVVGDEVRE